MGRVGCVLLLACGCSFHHGVVGGDGPLGDDDAPTDMSIDMAPLGPWSTPVKIPELTDNGTALDDPTLTGDMLEIYFNSDRSGNDEIWEALRSATADSFGPPFLVTELNTTSRESDPEVSPDGLTIYIASDRNGGAGSDDLWISTRTSRNNPWGTPVHLAVVNSSGSDDAATTDAAKQRLVFWSTRTGGAGMSDLYESTWTGSMWGIPAQLTSLCTPSNDYDPYLSPNALTIYFDSDRPGGMGMQDLYIATRSSTSAMFVSPTQISELNSNARDMDPWLSPDQRTIVFASNRSGEFEIYYATR